jgi:hypothetical protein
MDVVLVFILLFIFYRIQRAGWNRKLQTIQSKQRSPVGIGYIDLLFFLHLVLFLVYYVYTLLERSDSETYHFLSSVTENWFSLWGNDTNFIMFITWPFSHFLSLSYEACMLIFCFVGFQGVMLFYMAAKENILNLKPVYKNFTLTELVFLLPNVHFWSSSIGKGGTMLLGIGLIVYGLSRFQKRFLLIAVGAWLVYMIRGHILFLIILGAGAGLLFTLKGIKWYYKGLMILAVAIVGFSILGDMKKYTGSNSLDVSGSAKFQKRAVSNSSATSGVDIANYNQAQKLFTFWYRPLFVDAPGFLGIVVSFENMLYVLFTLQIIRYGFPNWKRWNGWFRIGLFIFLFGSLALAQIAGNLGIAMRQKAQIMPLFFIVYCKAMTYKGMKKRLG